MRRVTLQGSGLVGLGACSCRERERDTRTAATGRRALGPNHCGVLAVHGDVRTVRTATRAALGLLLAGLFGAPAHGQTASTPPAVEEQGSAEAAAKERARALYERGARAYADAKYQEAATQFLAAHRVYPTPEFLFNVAKAFDRLDHRAGALAYYREYARARPGSADEEVKRRIDELCLALAERGVQQLSVLSEPEDALVTLDGKPVGLTPWTGETWPGKHRLRVEASGYAPFETIATVDPQRAEDFTVKLERPATEIAASKTSSEPPPAPPAVTPLTWIVLGAGSAALATALFVEMANGDNTSGITRTGAFFAGAGLMGTALGGLLLYVDLSAGPGEARGSSVRPLPRRALVSLGARF